MKNQTSMIMPLIFTALFFLCSLYSTESFIKQRFKNAKEGDFALYEKQKNLHLLVIHSIYKDKLILEEMSFGKNALLPNTRAWLNSKEACFTSHNIIEIDLANTRVLECYSFTQNKFLQVTKDECFILNLIGLDFQEVSADDRRKIGPSPLDRGVDHRKSLEPTLYC